jgi:hypothetical protein
MNGKPQADGVWRSAKTWRNPIKPNRQASFGLSKKNEPTSSISKAPGGVSSKAAGYGTVGGGSKV